jgi:hypothetical protein
MRPLKSAIKTDYRAVFMNFPENSLLKLRKFRKLAWLYA